MTSILIAACFTLAGYAVGYPHGKRQAYRGFRRTTINTTAGEVDAWVQDKAFEPRA